MTSSKKHKNVYTSTPFGAILPRATRRAHRAERCRGYTLLVATIIGALLLSISFSIVTLTAKEVRLATVARDSQLAFYAADIGVECAIYWDIQYSNDASAFATSSESSEPSSGLICSQNDIAIGWLVTKTSNSATTEFTLDLGVLGDNSDLCAKVLVEKTNNGDNTKIESRGRNSCDTSNTRRVERAIRVTY